MARIYLAGPDVFLPDAKAFGERKKALCADYGLEGVFPLDDGSAENRGGEDLAFWIYRQNRATMDSCDVIVAHLTPFRGPSADAGTVYEVGYMTAQGKLAFGYANSGLRYIDRVRKFLPGSLAGEAGDYLMDTQGMQVEDFGLADNLMIEGALAASGGTLVARQVEDGKAFTDLGGFEECLRLVVEVLKKRGQLAA